VPLSGHLEVLSNGYWGQAWLQRKMSFWGLRSGMRRRGPRVARRHPNGESEEFWKVQLPWWRPDLRRDMVGVPKIPGPQEREMWNTIPTGNIFTMAGPQTLVGTPVPRTRASCNLALEFWGGEREITALHVRTHWGREDLEGSLASGGWQLEAHWGGGTSLWASE
jgi:hypothetical protein